MEIEIIERPLRIEVHGFPGTASNKDYSGTAFRLSGQVWKTVKDGRIKNKGKNIWVYDANNEVFAGVELEESGSVDSLLEHKTIDLAKYAHYKHVGPYNLIKEAGRMMTEELRRKGLESSLPYIEIYGHWQADESALETELIMSVR